MRDMRAACLNFILDESIADQGHSPYIADARLRSAWDLYSRGLIDSQGAVPVLVRGPCHMAPTYIVGSRGRCLTAYVASHFFFPGLFDAGFLQSPFA